MVTPALAFLSHRESFSLASGSHRLLVRARRRMAALPHCEDLLRRLLCPIAALRISVNDVVAHPVFHALQTVLA